MSQRNKQNQYPVGRRNLKAYTSSHTLLENMAPKSKAKPKKLDGSKARSWLWDEPKMSTFFDEWKPAFLQSRIQFAEGDEKAVQNGLRDIRKAFFEEWPEEMIIFNKERDFHLDPLTMEEKERLNAAKEARGLVRSNIKCNCRLTPVSLANPGSNATYMWGKEAQGYSSC
jgi:hypothetical protein